jgi:hypothetical protein
VRATGKQGDNERTPKQQTPPPPDEQANSSNSKKVRAFDTEALAKVQQKIRKTPLGLRTKNSFLISNL